MNAPTVSLKGLDLRTEIDRLRKERNAVILANYYQDPVLQDLADFVGDSLDLGGLDDPFGQGLGRSVVGEFAQFRGRLEGVLGGRVVALFEVFHGFLRVGGSRGQPKILTTPFKKT